MRNKCKCGGIVAETGEHAMNCEHYPFYDWQARAEKAEAELARLTTLRPADTHIDNYKALWWKRTIDGDYVPVEVCRYQPSSICLWWTPLPEPKEAEK